MTEETQALVANARAAITQLRDAARQVMGHRQRDPLVLAVHTALDRLDTTDRALTSLARDLETARQERDAAELQSTRWAFESMEQRKEHAAAVRAARAETETAIKERDEAQRQSHEDHARYMQHMGRADHYARENAKLRQERDMFSAAWSQGINAADMDEFAAKFERSTRRAPASPMALTSAPARADA